MTISAIKPGDLAKKNFIGYRRVQSDSESEEEEQELEENANEIPGMETSKAEVKLKKEKDLKFEKLKENCKSEKDVKKLVSHQSECQQT